MAGKQKVIDEWSVNNLMKAVKGKLAQFESPKFSSGDKCFMRKSEYINGKWECNSSLGIVISGPEVRNHQIQYEILIGGQCQYINIENMRKRK